MHTCVCVCECVHVYACLFLLCIIVCEQQLRATAAAHSFFSVLCSFLLSLSLPLICDLSSFRRQSSNSSHSRVEYLVWPQQLTRLHGVHFFCQAPLSLCLHIRPSIVKHVFYCVCVCVCLCIIFGLKYIHI